MIARIQWFNLFLALIFVCSACSNNHKAKNTSVTNTYKQLVSIDHSLSILSDSQKIDVKHKLQVLLSPKSENLIEQNYKYLLMKGILQQINATDNADSILICDLAVHPITAPIDTATYIDYIIYAEYMQFLKNKASQSGAENVKELNDLLSLAIPYNYYLLYRIYDQQAQTYAAQFNNTEAEKFLALYNQSYPFKKDDKYMAQYYRRKEIISQHTLDDSKHSYSDSILYYAQRSGNKADLSQAYGNLCNQFIKQHKIDSAKKYFSLFKSVVLQMTTPKTEAQQNYNVGFLYGNLGEYDSAIQYFNRSIAVLNKDTSMDARNFYSPYIELQELYAQKGDYKKAYLYYDTAYQKFADGEVQKSRNFSTLIQRTFDQKKNEAIIQTLKTEKENAAQKLRLYALSAAACLLLIGTWFYIYRQRMRRKKLLAEQAILQKDYDAILLKQRLLRTQMEPHFIFNALTNLQTLIENNKKEKASDYLLRFARLLRTSLENSAADFVSIQDEIDALENYLALQKMRFRSLFEYQINISISEEDIAIVQIPPMLIQPFVENAIIHGFKGINYKGILQINIHVANGNAKFTIEDNGLGMDNLKKKSGVSSTQISAERLNMLSINAQKQASLHIGKSKNFETGTLVSIYLPYVEAW